MITIVNYGLGNIAAFQNVFRDINLELQVAESNRQLMSASHIILPGVGSFDWAMKCVNRSGMRDTLDELVLNKGVPVLGVCVGMQIMALSSDEGTEKGLGWIDSHVRKINVDSIGARLPLPHMGWNNVYPLSEVGLFDGIQDGACFYFLHSYVACCENDDDRLSLTDYGSDFVSAFNSKNIYGVQFHPEKSHALGSKLLTNFVDVC